MKKRIAILGSTGSIGTSALDIIAKFPDRFQVVGLAAGKNGERLEEQVRTFCPKAVALSNQEAAKRLRKKFSQNEVEILSGGEGLIQVATLPEADLVIAAIVGAAGLLPTLSAITAGKDIALANKETLVMAGQVMTAEAKKHGVKILPVDSEHSAIYQCLEGHRRQDVRKIILTASGGPFLTTPISEMGAITPREALRHPTWQMGKKITIDSATLMNKGLEVIEARWLFDLPPEKIQILIHRQSIVHSMVEYVDGSIIAQLGVPDMRGPLAYALTYPERLPLNVMPLDLGKVGTLTFQEPEKERFPCLSFAYEAIRAGGTMPAVLNAANEEAVEAFLSEKIGFLKIPEVVRRTMDAHSPQKGDSVESVLEADRWAREKAAHSIRGRA